jgi:hypothetical protein
MIAILTEVGRMEWNLGFLVSDPLCWNNGEEYFFVDLTKILMLRGEVFLEYLQFVKWNLGLNHFGVFLINSIKREICEQCNGWQS